MAAAHGTEESTASASVELRKEAFTMALYLAICLLAALTAMPDDAADDADALLIVWGVTVGLAVAHWFAYHVSARLVAGGHVRHHDAQAALAQLGSAAALAVLASVPVLVLPGSAGLTTTRLLLAGFIGFVGYEVAQAAGASRVRSIAYAAVVLAAALVVVLIKNLLSTS